MNYTALLIHIVFSTNYRRETLVFKNRDSLYRYISGIISNLNCKPLAIRGIADHIHIFLDLRPSLSVSDLVKTLKQSCGNWIRESRLFPSFDGWQEGYFAGSVGPNGKANCIDYINNQELHHHGKSFIAEMEWLNLKYEIEEYIKEHKERNENIMP